MSPFFSKLAAVALLSLALAGQSAALLLTIDSFTCSGYEWTITVNQAEYFSNAVYVQFDVGNAANLSDYSYSRVTMFDRGDIYNYSIPFTFSANLDSLTRPGGDQWEVGVELISEQFNLVSNYYQYQTIANPCLAASTTSTTAPSSTSTDGRTSTGTSAPTGLPTPAPSAPKKNTTAYIAGGVVGAIALLSACILFFYLRKRKAAQKAQQQQNNNGQYYSREAPPMMGGGNGHAGMMEKGFVGSAPVDSVNQLPHSGGYNSGYNSGVSDYIDKAAFQSYDNRASTVPDFSSPPMSPRSSQWGAASGAPLPPMSPTLSATSRATNPLTAAPSRVPVPLSPTSAPARANNPLVNFNTGTWAAAAPSSSPAAAPPASGGFLPEPMSRC